MASSSVSQDDIDNDFEKNSRRSRIRTARARAHLRLESGGDRAACVASNSLGVVGTELPPLENVSVDRSGGDSLYELAESVSNVIGLSAASETIEGADGRLLNQLHAGNLGLSCETGTHSGKSTGLLQLRGTGSNIDRDPGGAQRSTCSTDRTVPSDRLGSQAVFIPSLGSSCIGGIPEGHETSPKPGVIRTGKDKCSVRNKLHHVNKGTQGISARLWSWGWGNPYNIDFIKTIFTFFEYLSQRKTSTRPSKAERKAALIWSCSFSFN